MSWAVWVRGGGGGGVLLGILGGVCRQVLQILTRVSNQENVIFHIHFQTRPLYPCPFSDLAFRQKLCYHYLERKPKKYSNPFRIRIFLFLSSSFEIETINTFIRSRSSLESHTRFQTKMGKVYTRLQTKTAQKPHNGTKHTYIAYIREYPTGIWGPLTSVISVVWSVWDSRAFICDEHQSYHNCLKRVSSNGIWQVDSVFSKEPFTVFHGDFLSRHSLRTNPACHVACQSNHIITVNSMTSMLAVTNKERLPDHVIYIIDSAITGWVIIASLGRASQYWKILSHSSIKRSKKSTPSVFHH